MRQAHADGRASRLDRREGGGGHRRLPGARHVRQLLHRPRGREGLHGNRRTAGAAAVPGVTPSGGSSEAKPAGRERQDGFRSRSAHLARLVAIPMIDLALQRTEPRQPARQATAWERLNAHRGWLSLWFMLPAAGFLILFLAYPLGLGMWISFTDARIGRSGAFVGLENYEWLWDDSVFWLSVFNTLLYTAV